jgi:hypothetical protein
VTRGVAMDQRQMRIRRWLAAPPDTHPFLVVKQDNNGTTFVITDIEILGLTGIDRIARTSLRPIGPWTHPTSCDISVFIHSTGSTLDGRSTSDPPF